jgi:flagellar hook-associated protein 2
MPIQLTGLSGGFDASGVITQLVALAKQPVTDLTAKKALVDSAVSTMNTFTSRLATLRATATALADSSGYASFAAASSDASVVASANGSAQGGSYDVQVTQLAAGQKMRGTTQASSSTALGMSGSLSIVVGTNAAVNITVAATDTLGDIATKLATSGMRLSASVLYDGSAYRLSVQGLDTGAANGFTVTQTGLDLGLANPANVYQAATDAHLTVDGLAITRPTNQITEVIPGVTLALTKTGVSSTVRVTSDTTTLKAKVQGFVSAFNDIVNAGHTATGYSTVKATNSVLAGESSIRRALDSFGRLMGGAIPGSSGAYTTLGSVGVKLGTNGTLTFDSTLLDTAITNDPNGVRRLFITDTALGATGVMKTMASTIDALVTGSNSPIKARIAALGATSTRLDASAAAKQVRVDAYEQQLRKQYAKLDEAQSRYSSMSAAITSIGSTST